MEVENRGSDEEIALRGIEAMEAHFRAMGMPTSIEELGITLSEEDCKELAKRAALGCGGKRGSAKVFYEEDFYQVYLLARKH